MTKLSEMKCSAGGQAKALSDTEIAAHLANLFDWQVEKNEIIKTFTFKNYHETMAFVNASAWISHLEDHHPDIGLHYNRCVVHFSTHDAGGITLNDFICAAKLDQLFAQ
jgi:4a-hydroxytetrahydrobiopterin dehydratase